jgi:carbonic anhydrase
MKKSILFCASLLIATAFISCKNAKTTQTETSQASSEEVVITQKPKANTLLTKEQRDALTPDEVLEFLMAGNQRYTDNDLTVRDHATRIRKSVLGQYPKAMVLSCLDSRVPVEDVFDRGIGDLFVGRVAGNFVNEDLLGSMEFACKVSGAKLILVLGHEQCGAVKAAIDDVELGNITAMLSKIKPAVEKTTYEGERTSSNPDFVRKVGDSNILNTIEQIRKNSPILKEMEDNGEIKIVGAVYSLETGRVTVL